MAEGTKSASEIIVLLFAGGVGTGVLVLPRAMAAVGYLPMFGLLVVGSLISAATTWMLFMGVTHVRRQRSEDLQESFIETNSKKDSTASAGPTYGELLSIATCPSMSTFLDVMLLIYAGGAVVTYYIFLAGFVQRLPFWPEALTQHITIVLMAVITYPATLFRSIGALAKLSNVVVIVLFCLIFSIWFRLPAAAAALDVPAKAVTDVDKSGAVLCTCIYAFVWHNNCVAVSRELRDPTPLRCATIALGATSLLCFLYALIAFGGYWSWGDHLHLYNSILDAYNVDDPLFIALRVALTSSLLVSVDLNIFPLRESCWGLVRKFVPDYQPSAIGHGMWSFAIIAIASTAAILYPAVTKVITFLGGTIGPFMCIIFPVLISRLVLSRGAWYFALAVFIPISLFLNLAGFGLVGKPV